MNDINYFLNSNSSNGFVSFLNSNTAGTKNIINLSSYPSVAAEDIIKSVIKRARAAEIPVEVIHNCLDNSIEGVIIPDLSVCVINCPVYYNDCLSVSRLENEPLLNKCRCILDNAYKCFADALKVHDKWEEIYIDNIDFKKLDKLTENLCSKILKGIKFERKGVSKDRFFGAATINGSVDYIDNITADLKKRYFIKGRPGSGKSTIMKKIAQKALESGCDVDIYHCAFDPKSLDMIVIKQLDLCVFDSTAPHEYFPTRPTDEIVDVFAEAINPDTDIKYKTMLQDISVQYKSNIAVAVKYLNDAYKCCEEINKKYLDRLDYKELKNVKNIVIKKCFGIAN